MSEKTKPQKNPVWLARDKKKHGGMYCLGRRKMEEEGEYGWFPVDLDIFSSVDWEYMYPNYKLRPGAKPRLICLDVKDAK